MDANPRPFAERYPGLGTGPLPIEPYLSPQIFEAEREQVFRRSWLCVGRTDELPEPGSWLVRELPVCATSVLVVRGQDGQTRAFHNVCRHRMNHVVVGECGYARHLVCGFHGWVYGLDGQLLSVPDEGSFHDLDKPALGLKALPTDVWEGFIFVHLADRPSLTLREFIGELWDQYAGFPMADMTRLCTIRATLECNWKVVLDAFQEAYHVLELHRRSAPQAFNGRENPLAHLNSVRLFQRHRAISVYGNPAQKPSPAAALALKLARTATYTPALGDKRGAMPPGVNPDQRADWAFDETLLYPNMSWYTADGWALVQYYWPITAHRTAYEQHFYSYAPTTVSGMIGLEHTKTLLFDVALEDLSTVERIQSAASSRAVDQMWLSDQEIAIRHSHSVIDRALQEGAS